MWLAIVCFVSLAVAQLLAVRVMQGTRTLSGSGVGRAGAALWRMQARLAAVMVLDRRHHRDVGGANSVMHRVCGDKPSKPRGLLVG